MLVSLSIKHFKSIREAHIRFGPFTCFTGRNGVGKSNLFDAIHFLAALADRDVSGAATAVRRTSDGGYSPLDLVFGRDPNRRIELCARMVVLNTHSPEVARQLSIDDLVFVERALTKNDGPVSAFRPV